MSPPGKVPITDQDRKSPAMSPPRKDPIPNQDSKKIINEEDPILPPLLAKYHTGYKQLFNDTHSPNRTEDKSKDSTDNSRNDVDDYFIILNANKDEDKGEEYKYLNSPALNIK